MLGRGMFCGGGWIGESYQWKRIFIVVMIVVDRYCHYLRFVVLLRSDRGLKMPQDDGNTLVSQFTTHCLDRTMYLDYLPSPSPSVTLSSWQMADPPHPTDPAFETVGSWWQLLSIPVSLNPRFESLQPPLCGGIGTLGLTIQGREGRKCHFCMDRHHVWGG